uniref:Exostosin GT47 domain-containing protein n=1 Tax=Panagrolaimus davidi TaxID=227884 RepID=A0A914QDS5_9BILA
MGEPHQLKYLDDTKIIRWFAKNAGGKHPKLEPLPLGLPPYNYTLIHEASKNLKNFHQRNITLYLNFSPNTHPDRYAIRKYVEILYKNDSDVMIVKNWTLWTDYLQHLNNSKFVISPPGVGLDCYRTWEAIIMGAIPFILQSEISSLAFEIKNIDNEMTVYKV